MQLALHGLGQLGQRERLGQEGDPTGGAQLGGQLALAPSGLLALAVLALLALSVVTLRIPRAFHRPHSVD